MKRWAILFLLLPLSATSAEVVHLIDGSTLDGQVRRTADGYLVTTADGTTRVIPAGEVTSIELKNSFPSSRPVERLGATSGAGGSSQRPRLTPAEVARRSAAAAESAEAIAPLVADEHTSAASAALDKALAAAPDSPGLLYLRGLVLFQQGQLVPSRQAFRQVEKRLPQHAPTHNNLAVILWTTHALIPALAEYDKAMLATPADRTILDNVAEALHALPENLRKNAITLRVVQHFQEQDAQLQDQMRAHGLRRVGATWISTQEYDKRVESQKAAAEKKETYPADLLALQARLLEIDRTIKEDMQVLKAMKQESTWVLYGEIVPYPLPERYYQLESEVSKLKAERIMKERQLAQLPKSLRESLQRAATNDYTGKQNLIGISGTPGLPPTTQPATEPS